MRKVPSEPEVRFELGELAALLGAELIGDPTRAVTRIGALDSAGADTVSFISNPKYIDHLAASKAACVIVSPAHRVAAVARGDTLVATDPYLCFARLTQLWAGRLRRTNPPQRGD